MSKIWFIPCHLLSTPIPRICTISARFWRFNAILCNHRHIKVTLQNSCRSPNCFMYHGKCIYAQFRFKICAPGYIGPGVSHAVMERVTNLKILEEIAFMNTTRVVSRRMLIMNKWSPFLQVILESMGWAAQFLITLVPTLIILSFSPWRSHVI